MKFYILLLKLNSDQNSIILFFILLCLFMYLNFRIAHTIFIIFFIFLFGLKTNNYFDFINLSYILNKNLTNGLLIIHPLILYFSYANFLYLFFYFLNKIILFIFYGLKTNFKKTIIFYILLYIYTSIFLGS